MNPNVVKYAGQVGFDAGKYTWFDLSRLSEGYEDEFNAYSREQGWDKAKLGLKELLLPSNNLAIIPKEDNGEPVFIVTYSLEFSMGKYNGPAVCAWIAAHPDPVPAAIIVNAFNEATNSYLHVRPDFQKTLKDNDMFEKLEKIFLMKPVISVMLLNHKSFVDHNTLSAYQGIDNKPYINKKRRAKDKPPVYDWVTVELTPSAPRREHQGGTHASPARHERRGHLRRYPSGKVAWVKPTWVGSIERGLIVHDYVPEPA